MRPDRLAQLRMRWIRPGRYLRGSGEDVPEALPDERPQHEVVLTRGFWLSDAPVTQALWVTVMGENPSALEGAEHPVEMVGWEDCQRFCARLWQLCPGLQPRLPTEAEWEYAARAGTTTPRYGALDDIAWHRGNSGGQTHPVRQKQPNPWGLYDMLGNVWEWCQDQWGFGNPYSAGAELQVDPLGTDGSERVCRGGSWSGSPRRAHAAYRDADWPGIHSNNLGFRLVGGHAPGRGATEGGGEGRGARPPPGGPGGEPAVGPEPTEPR